MPTISIRYEGQLHTVCKHEQSGTEISTDGPTDNHGRGESFSPTDLVATGLGACMLSIMGIVADRHDWDLTRATADVNKIMVADPARRIARIEVTLTIPGDFDSRARTALEKAALNCPVHKTLGANVEMPVTFRWDD